MTDHTFVVSYEFGYEGSEVLGVFLTHDAALAHTTTLDSLGYAEINEWAGANRVRSWRFNHSESEPWVEQPL